MAAALHRCFSSLLVTSCGGRVQIAGLGCGVRVLPGQRRGVWIRTSPLAADGMGAWAARQCMYFCALLLQHPLPDYRSERDSGYIYLSSMPHMVAGMLLIMAGMLVLELGRLHVHVRWWRTLCAGVYDTAGHGRFATTSEAEAGAMCRPLSHMHALRCGMDVGGLFQYTGCAGLGASFARFCRTMVQQEHAFICSSWCFRCFAGSLCVRPVCKKPRRVPLPCTMPPPKAVLTSLQFATPFDARSLSSVSPVRYMT